MHRGKSGMKTLDKTGIFIKILTNYLQIVGIVFTFGLNFSPGVQNAVDVPKTVGNPVGEMSYSMDCFLS